MPEFWLHAIAAPPAASPAVRPSLPDAPLPPSGARLPRPPRAGAPPAGTP